MFVADKLKHNRFQFPFWHLPMRDSDARLGDELLNSQRNTLDILNAIVNKEHLSIAT